MEEAQIKIHETRKQVALHVGDNRLADDVQEYALYIGRHAAAGEHKEYSGRKRQDQVGFFVDQHIVEHRLDQFGEGGRQRRRDDHEKDGDGKFALIPAQIVAGDPPDQRPCR